MRVAAAERRRSHDLLGLAALTVEDEPLGWWKRGGTSIHALGPKIRAAPGIGACSEVVSVALRPSSKPSSSVAYASTPLGSGSPPTLTARGAPSTICANETT